MFIVGVARLHYLPAFRPSGTFVGSNRDPRLQAVKTEVLIFFPAVRLQIHSAAFRSGDVPVCVIYLSSPSNE